MPFITLTMAYNANWHDENPYKPRFSASKKHLLEVRGKIHSTLKDDNEIIQF